MTRLPRRNDAEILDEGLLNGEPLDPQVLAASLAQVEAVDRWLGGERALRRHLDRLLPTSGRCRVLDVGTGNGTLLRRVVSRLRRRGLDASGVGIELDSSILAVAAATAADRPAGSADVHLVQGDGLLLPLADGAVDVSFAVLTAHHFDEASARALLAEMVRVSRRGVVISDLERSVPAWLGARLLSATVWRRNPITRHDGPLSVLRGFTRAELLALGHSTGLSVEVAWHPLFRLTMLVLR